MSQLFSLVALFISLAHLQAAAGQPQTFAIKPPGEVLLKSCKEISSNTPGHQAVEDRIYCYRFIEATLMMERFLSQKQNDSFEKFQLQEGPLTTRPPHFCYSFNKSFGISAPEVASIAKKLVLHLQSQPQQSLEKLSSGDDAQMRLLMAFMMKSYPC